MQELARHGLHAGTACLNGAAPETWRHYPDDDARDDVRGIQYYYHCHVSRPAIANEHGHFHVFLRQRHSAPPAHLVALSIDALGQPLRAFTTNAWVTGERPLPARRLAPLAARLHIESSHHQMAVDRWLAALIRLFSPQIAWLLERRDQRIEALTNRERGLEDRRIQIWSQCRLSVPEQITALAG